MSKLKIINKKAKELGYGQILPSTRKTKKYMTRYNGKLIHFGAEGYEDFLDHKDFIRREQYRSRHSKIRLKDGTLAFQKKGTPSHLSYHLLW